MYNVQDILTKKRTMCTFFLTLIKLKTWKILKSLAIKQLLLPSLRQNFLSYLRHCREVLDESIRKMEKLFFLKKMTRSGKKKKIKTLWWKERTIAWRSKPHLVDMNSSVECYQLIALKIWQAASQYKKTKQKYLVGVLTS